MKYATTRISNKNLRMSARVLENAMVIFSRSQNKITFKGKLIRADAIVGIEDKNL